MTGPFDRIFGNSGFDLNHDGKIDAGEAAYIYTTLFEEEERARNDEEEELRDEIEFMDPEDRRQAIEDAGYDPDDFGDDFGDDF
jgi:hypothetical protein